jgi:uncharacterized membrane protein YfcA
VLDPWWQVPAIALAGLAAGSANAIAGGGGAIGFPVLVMAGLPPVAANASNAVGLLPGAGAAAWSYRAETRRAGAATLWLAAPSLAGGAVGAWLLIHLPAGWFAALAPWLVLLASAMVAVEPLAQRWIGGADMRTSPRTRAAGFAAWFAIALYGGYFGAGMGLMLLVTLGLLGLDDLQHANGMKNLLSVAIKLPAILYFIVLGLPAWPATLALMAGGVAGGWITGRLIQRIDAGRLRWVVAGVGASLGLFMLLH